MTQHNDDKSLERITHALDYMSQKMTELYTNVAVIANKVEHIYDHIKNLDEVRRGQIEAINSQLKEHKQDIDLLHKEHKNDMKIINLEIQALRENQVSLKTWMRAWVFLGGIVVVAIEFLPKLLSLAAR